MLDPDLLIVLGVLAILGSGALTVSAFSSSNQSFRPAAGLLILALAMMFMALRLNPDGYEMAEIPMIFADAMRGVLPN